MSNVLLSTQKAADYLGVSISTIYRMEEQGILNPIKTIGGQRRFSVEELDSYKEKSKSNIAPQNPSLNNDIKVLNNDEITDENEYGEEMDFSKFDVNPDKPVDPRNTLNDLNGSQWMPETKSFFYQKGLGSKHPHAQIERQHPAPYSFQDISHLVAFFTKKGMSVLDPFGGVGSTAKACEILGRHCTSIELQEKWHLLSIERLETETGIGTSKNHTFINGDARLELQKINDSVFDFVVTSPPYWSILNKKADHKVKQERIENNLATNYSDNDPRDLANCGNYSEFLDILVNDVFLQCARVLKPKKYMCIVVSDFRNKSEFISFHSDLIQKMANAKTTDGYKLVLSGVKVLLQNHKSLLPYGYPFAYVENIHHQYILIFRKDK